MTTRTHPRSRWLMGRMRRRDMAHRRGQIIAVAVTVLLGVTLYVAAYNSYLGLNGSYERTYDELNFADVWITGGDSTAMLDSLAGLDGVRTETRLQGQVPLRTGGRHKLTGRLVGLPDGGQPDINRLQVIDGRLPGPGGGPLTVAMERHGADHFHLNPGDTIEVFAAGEWNPATLGASVFSPEYLWLAADRSNFLTLPDDFAVVSTDTDTVRRLDPTAPTQILVTVAGHDPATIDRVEEIARRGGATDVYDRSGQPSNQALSEDVLGFAEMAFLFPLLFLSAAGMATYVLLARLIATQRTELGMMMANGYGSGDMFRHFMGYGLTVALLGGVPGLAVGAWLGRVITDAYAHYVDLPVVRHVVSPWTILIGLAFTLVTGAAAGGFPARTAARIEPAEAMRPAAPRGVGRRSLLERAVPRPWRTPGVAMVTRNLSRQRKRTATTVLGVVLAAVLILVALSLLDSLQLAMKRQFGQIDRRDLAAQLNHQVTPSDTTGIEAIDGVSVAEPYLQTQAVLATTAGADPVGLFAFRSDTVMHEQRPGAIDDGILIHRDTGRRLRVAVGDPVTVKLVSGQSFTLPVAGFHDEMLIGAAYISLDTLGSAGGPAADSVAVTLAPGVDHAELRDVLSDRAGVVSVTDYDAIADLVNQLMGLSTFFIGIMVAFGLVMAIALVYNAVTIAISERTAEVATLSANGVSRGWIRRTITAENLTAVFLGLVPGVIAGQFLGRVFLGTFDTEGFSFPFVLSGRSQILTLSLLVVAGLVGQIPGLRSLDRIDLPAAVRERSV